MMHCACLRAIRLARQRARAQKRDRVCRDSLPGHVIQPDDLPPEIFAAGPFRRRAPR